MIFAVFDALAVIMCINYSFFTFILLTLTRTISELYSVDLSNTTKTDSFGTEITRMSLRELFEKHRSNKVFFYFYANCDLSVKTTLRCYSDFVHVRRFCICRVARTHSRYWKLTKFHHASPPFLSFPYHRRSTSIQIQIQLKSIINSPKLLANTQHTLVCSLHLLSLIHI